MRIVPVVLAAGVLSGCMVSVQTSQNRVAQERAKVVQEARTELVKDEIGWRLRYCDLADYAFSHGVRKIKVTKDKKTTDIAPDIKKFCKETIDQLSKLAKANPVKANPIKPAGVK